MISIDITSTGAGTVTPPASGVWTGGRADRVVRMAPYAAPLQGTGLPVAGSTTAFRLRGLTAAAGTTGAPAGAPLARPSVQTTVRQGSVVFGAPVEQISTTPGDLPPEDPLS